MAENLIEKILAAHLIRREGEHLLVKYDHLLLHDATGALVIDRFQQLNRPLADPGKILAAADHFVPPASVERAEILQKYLDFISSLKGVRNRPYEGICHQLLVEDALTGPGQFMIGADSHTVMAGGLGAMATGLGSTDILFSMITGWTWMPKPVVWRLDITGKRQPWIRGKDVALAVLRDIGKAPAGPDLAYECCDLTTDGLSMDSRFSLSCMGVEMGVAFFVMVPDARTKEFLQKKKASGYEMMEPDKDAVYANRVSVAVPDKSLVSMPPAPWCVEEADSLGDIAINQAFVGSCTGGRLEDIADTAQIIKGRNVAENVRLIVIPASRKIYLEALAHGYIETIIKAGGMVETPSCGPCGGIDKGIVGKGQVMIATSNRNFPGRTGMGDTYLASAPVVAASAITGRITTPEEIILNP